MFHIHGDRVTKYRTLSDAAQAILASEGIEQGGQKPIWQKVTTRPAPYDLEVAAYVRRDANGDPYFVRIDRDGYDLWGTRTYLTPKEASTDG